MLDRNALRMAKWRFIVPVMLASVVPDFDVLPGLLLGDPNRFHGGWSHSFGFAAIAAGIVVMTNGTMRCRVSVWLFVSWGTHCMLDAMTVDGRPPFGVPLFWPFTTHAFYISPPIFTGFLHGAERSSTGEFFAEVFSIENVRVMLVESVLGLVFILVSMIIGWCVVRVSWRNKSRH